jgi:hypothetical protein
MDIEVSYSRKVQLEQFEPIEHRVTLSSSVPDDEDAEEAYEELADRAEEMVESQLAARIAQKKLESDDE